MKANKYVDILGVITYLNVFLVTLTVYLKSQTIKANRYVDILCVITYGNVVFSLTYRNVVLV